MPDIERSSVNQTIAEQLKPEMDALNRAVTDLHNAVEVEDHRDAESLDDWDSASWSVHRLENAVEALCGRVRQAIRAREEA